MEECPKENILCKDCDMIDECNKSIMESDPDFFKDNNIPLNPNKSKG